MRLSRLARSLLGAASLTILWLPGVPASAAPEPAESKLSQARQRFGEARKLEDSRRWGDALELFKKVAEVKVTPQVRFHIALCKENLGLWTEALDGYAQAVGEAKGSAPDVLIEANEHLRKLEASIPTVTLRVSDAAAGDELFLDQRSLPIDDHLLAIRADPGPHRAEVRRGETLVAREYLTLEPKTTRRIELRIGSIAEPPPGWSGLSSPGEAPRDASPPKAPTRDGSLQRTLGYVALGLSGAAAVTTGVFIGLRSGALGRLEADCPTLTRCPRSVEPTVSKGKTYAAMVDVFGVLTGVAAASGIALLVTAPPRAHGAGTAAPQTSVILSPVLGAGCAGLTMNGAF